MRGFYTYLHCKPDGTPFYVGKGSGKRAQDFVNNRNRHYLNIVSKYSAENIGVFVFPCESERAAFDDEIQQIACLKREGYALANLTYGGEGPAGMRHSEETKKRLSENHTGRKFTDGHRAKIAAALRGRKRPEFSAEWKEKIAAALSVREITPETRAKLSENAKGNKYALGLKRGPMSDEQKAKMSASKKGAVPWNKGIKKCQ